MRILIVDDSAFMRKAITQMITSDPALQVVGTARNGKEGVEMAKALKPDVITMDIEMPEMDGLTALRHIMRECPTQVLMFSSLTTEGSQAALRALTIGAADVLAKDTSQISLTITQMQDDLLMRVRALGQGRVKPSPTRQADVIPSFRPGQFDIVCIGSSTGGPPVLQEIVHAMPASMRTPIVIAQHMPRMFTESLAQRMSQTCAMKVHHAEHGMMVEPGSIYIAPGGQHTHLEKAGPGRFKMRISDEPKSENYRPSVNVLLSTAAAAGGRRVLGVVLTGIGEDGLIGGRELKARGGTILAQTAETCVVYGMPKAVTQAGITSASLSPSQLGQAIAQLAIPALNTQSKAV